MENVMTIIALIQSLRMPRFAVAAQGAIDASTRGFASTIVLAPRRLWSFFGTALRLVAGVGAVLMDVGQAIVNAGFKIGIYGFAAWSGARLIQYIARPFAQTAALEAAAAAAA
jgi:hypothetical protein